MYTYIPSWYVYVCIWYYHDRYKFKNSLNIQLTPDRLCPCPCPYC